MVVGIRVTVGGQARVVVGGQNADGEACGGGGSGRLLRRANGNQIAAVDDLAGGELLNHNIPAGAGQLLNQPAAHLEIALCGSRPRAKGHLPPGRLKRTAAGKVLVGRVARE